MTDVQRRRRIAAGVTAGVATAAAAVVAFASGGSGGGVGDESASDLSPGPAKCLSFACAERLRPWPRNCDRRVRGAEEAREALESVRPGKVVCLGAGSYGELDLTGIERPIGKRVTLRGAPGRKTSVEQISFGGSTGLVLEGMRILRGVDSANQQPTHHVTIRGNDIGGEPGAPNDGADAIRAIGDWSGPGQHSIQVVRNRIHDTSGYGIRAQGNAPGWTVRSNVFERIGDADYIQTGMPANWVVDHNWFLGPSFRSSEGAHPDLWQSLDPNPPGTSITFTRNRVDRTDGLTLGFIFGDVATDDGSYHRIRIENNLFNRVADGEACQLSNSVGLRFERNTLLAGANGWACRFGQDGESPATNYKIRRNVFADSKVSRRGGPGHISCGPDRASCAAVAAGSSHNVSDDRSARGPKSIRNWRPKWSRDGWYRARGLRYPAGHNLRPGDYTGWPFPSR